MPAKPRLDIKLLKAVFDQYVKKPRDLDHFDPDREILLNILHRNRLDKYDTHYKHKSTALIRLS